MKRQGQKKGGGRASREKWVRQVGESVCKNYVANLATVDAKKVAESEALDRIAKKKGSDKWEPVL